MQLKLRRCPQPSELLTCVGPVPSPAEVPSRATNYSTSRRLERAETGPASRDSPFHASATDPDALQLQTPDQPSAMADRPHLEKQHSSKPADEGSAKALSGHEIQLKMMDNERRLSKYTADADDGEDDEPERRQVRNLASRVPTFVSSHSMGKSTLANVLVSNMNFTKSKAPGKLGPKMAEKFAGKMLGAVHRRLALAQFKKMLCHGILVKHVTVKGKEAHLTFYATHEWTGIKYFSDAKHGCRKRGPAARKFFFAERERIVAAAAAGPPAEHPLLKTLRLAPEDYAKTAVIEFADGTGLACLCASPLYCKIVVEGLNLCLSNLDADGCLVASAHDGTLKSRKRNVSERMHLHQLHHLYHPHKHPNVSRVQPIDIGTMVEVMHVNAGKNDGAYVTSVRLPDTAGELQSYELTLNDNPLFKRGQYIRGHVLDYDAEADTCVQLRPATLPLVLVLVLVLVPVLVLVLRLPTYLSTPRALQVRYRLLRRPVRRRRPPPVPCDQAAAEGRRVPPGRRRPQLHHGRLRRPGT
jgi:hypothetical protein